MQLRREPRMTYEKLEALKLKLNVFDLFLKF